MNKIISFFVKNKYILLLLLVEVVLFITNYKPGAYIVGWDNVFPDLNFKANFERNIFSIWQEYRGLGLLDGMSHAALLPHTILTFLLSIIVPSNLIRYAVIFGSHLLGGIGVYLLLQKIHFHRRSEYENRELFSLIGALFYQVNIATIQMFFTPLEVFAYHFAALPLLLYFAYKFVAEKSHSAKWIFFILSIIFIPQAHVPSVFLVFLFAFIIFLYFQILHALDKKAVLKRSAVLLLMTIVLNMYWSLPYAYTTLKQSKTIINSKINQMGTDNIVARNKAFGNFVSVATLRGFTLDYVDFQPSGANDYMMKAWRTHVNSPLMVVLSFIIFTVSIFGVYRSLKKKETVYYPFIFLFGFTFLVLGNDIFILSSFSTFLQKVVPLFYSVFRFTFTKFSILYVFCISIFLTNGLHELYHHSRRIPSKLFLTTVFLLLCYYCFPAFKGDFIYNNEKLVIPKSYLELIQFFDSQNTRSRIATLPQPSYWGWSYYSWGGRGSGFIWYGLPQATLDGAFYPWSRENENYYWELSQAVYSNSATALKNVFTKYGVSWVIIDRNIISPFSERATYTEKTTELIAQIPELKKIKSFDKLDVYTNSKVTDSVNQYVSVAPDILHISPEYKWGNTDKGYSDFGMYFSDNSSQKSNTESSDVFYPFRSLFSGRKQEELEFTVKDQENYFSFSNTLPSSLRGSSLVIPPIKNEEITEIDSANLVQGQTLYPEVYLDNQLLTRLDSTTLEVQLPQFTTGQLEIRIPKIGGYYSSTILPDANTLNVKNCDQFNRGKYTMDDLTSKEISGIRLTSIGASSCLDFDLPQLSQRFGYLVHVVSKNVQGKGLFFAVTNKSSLRSDIETYLPTKKSNIKDQNTPDSSFFVLPPMEYYGLGYSLHVDNNSVGRDKTVNELGKITINPIPYDFLTSLKIVKPDFIWQEGEKDPSIQPKKVYHPNPSYYEVTLNATDNSQDQENPFTSHLILSQSFDSGWKAYMVNDVLTDSWYMRLLIPLFGKEVKTHELVNNWENGWKLDSTNMKACKNQGDTCVVAIVYLPQYLEYVGFTVLMGYIIYNLLKKRAVTATAGNKGKMKQTQSEQRSSEVKFEHFDVTPVFPREATIMS